MNLTSHKQNQVYTYCSMGYPLSYSILVNDFLREGSLIIDPAEDFANCKQKAWSAIAKTNSAWKSTAISAHYIILYQLTI